LIDRKEIAGVIILYNPADGTWDNIVRCSEQVKKLYIVDNSDERSQLLDKVELGDNTEVIYRGRNIGIAKALNLAAYKAIGDGAKYLLTMDQDSVIGGGHVEKLAEALSCDPQIGMISPYIVHERNPKTPSGTGLEKIVTAMTSGCVLNLEAFQKAGNFLDVLFIDYVDIEYCLRLQLNGFSVMQLNAVTLVHSLGNVEKRKLLFMTVFPTNHSAIRLYYRTRNRCYVHAQFKKYFPDYIATDRIDFMKELAKVLLFEQQKMKKLTMMLRGYLDFRKNKFGTLR